MATLAPRPSPSATWVGRRGRPTRSRAWWAAGSVVTLLLAGCSAAGDEGSGSGTTAPAHGHGATALPGAHVHGLGIDPADGRVLVATHGGLFRHEATGPVAVGPVIDLMGFSVAGPDHFYASGHPGPGVDLPNPVGLIESTDGGRTWVPVSRQGRTDFHALAASAAGVVGFDGAALLRTPDGVTWSDLRVPVPVHDVAASPDGTTLVVTSPAGAVRSTDAGAAWAAMEGAPLLQEVAFADATTVVGVTPDGAVFVSEDAGATWSGHGSAGGSPQAVTAARTTDGAVDVVIATTDALVRSVGGEPFGPVTVG